MKITTKDVISILPFENAFKEDLLSRWDSLSEDQRFDLEGVIWDTYSDLYQIRLDTNTELALQELSEGKESMDDAFGQRVREKTDDEFEQLFQHKVPAADLAEARGKLQDIIEKITPAAIATGVGNPNAGSNDPSSNPSN